YSNLSPAPVRAWRPPGRKATLLIEPAGSSSRRNSLPVAASHNRAVLSAPPDRICRPSGEKAALCTMFVWPTKRWISCPLAASHNGALAARLQGQTVEGPLQRLEAPHLLPGLRVPPLHAPAQAAAKLLAAVRGEGDRRHAQLVLFLEVAKLAKNEHRFFHDRL